MLAALRNAGLASAAALTAYCATGALLASLLASYGGTPFQNANRVAALAFLISLVGLIALRRAMQHFPYVTTERPPAARSPEERAAFWAGAGIATAWVLVALPSTYRATGSIREVMVFWHDEGITLEMLYRYVTTEGAVPEYRLLQGWLTFLPVALACKAINAFVPVEIGTINLMMRHYDLAVCWGVVWSGYVLAFLLTRSLALSAVVVVLAFWRADLLILLAIDRPDGFQLLFMLLSLINLVRFSRHPRAEAMFWALACAGFAFASKYSGHLLLPAIGAAWLWRAWRSGPVLAAGGSCARELAAATAVFAVASGAALVLSFFLASPYHLVNFWPFVGQIRHFLPIYKTGNIYNLPDYDPPPSAVLWWSLLSGRSELDYWMLICAGAGLAVCVAVVVSHLRRGRLRPEAPVCVWVVTYAAFMIWRYGGDLVEYRYVLPVLLFIPYFALYPVWLAAERVRANNQWIRGGLMGTLFIAAAVSAQPQLSGMFLALSGFRATAGPSFDVGRFLDRRVPEDASPRILMTNLAYIPERFTKLTVANVTVTMEMIAKGKYDYVIMSDNMYEVYAGKSAKPGAGPYYESYDVYYGDVVEAYTAFKNRTHPDYRFLKRFGTWEIFERIR